MGGLESQMRNIAMGAWLHDIASCDTGCILLKPGPLTDEERASCNATHRSGMTGESIRSLPTPRKSSSLIMNGAMQRIPRA